MFDLFNSEFKRYRLYAYIAGFLILVLAATLSSIKPIMHNELEVLGYIVISGLLAFTLGAIQMYMHKRKSNWAYLVHRPLAIEQIFYSLASAGINCIFIAITAPFLLLFVGLDLLNIDIVEARHYLFVLHLTCIALFFYFVAIYTLLNPSWGTILSISLLYLMLSSDPVSAGQTLLTDIICLLMVVYLAKRSFKINIHSHFTQKREIFVATSAMHVALMIALMISQAFLYHFPLMIVDKHPDSYEKEQLQDYFAIIWELDGQELVDYVVDENNYPTKAQLIKQMKLAKGDHVRADFKAPPALGQIFHQDKSYALNDDANNTRWLFSHKHQIFIGKHQRTNSVIGYLTKQDFLPKGSDLSQLTNKDKFQQVPAVIADQFIRTANTIYIVDFDDKYIEIKHQLAEDEYYTNNIQWPREITSVALVSNTALYLFDAKSFSEANESTEPLVVINHPRPLDNETRFIAFYDVIDGYVFNYYSSDYYGFDRPGTSLIYVKHDGTTTFLGEKSFKGYRPIPDVVHHQEYWMSPLVFRSTFYYLEGLYKHKNDPRHMSLSEVYSMQYSSQIYQAIAATTLLTLLLTWWLGNKIQLSKGRKFYWLFIVTLFGVPGFLSFLLLNRWKEAFKQSQQPIKEAEVIIQQTNSISH